MLTDASIEGKIDRLLGLKENVIIGKLIPAATGLRRYRQIEIGPTDPVARERLPAQDTAAPGARGDRPGRRLAHALASDLETGSTASRAPRIIDANVCASSARRFSTLRRSATDAPGADPAGRKPRATRGSLAVSTARTTAAPAATRARLHCPRSAATGGARVSARRCGPCRSSSRCRAPGRRAGRARSQCRRGGAPRPPADSLSAPTFSILSSRTASAIRSASSSASSRLDSGRITANSSPPTRQAMSVERTAARMRSATPASTASPPEVAERGR